MGHVVGGRLSDEMIGLGIPRVRAVSERGQTRGRGTDPQGCSCLASGADVVGEYSGQAKRVRLREGHFSMKTALADLVSSVTSSPAAYSHTWVAIPPTNCTP